MCAIQGLMVHKRRGHGPGIVEVLPLLEQWHREDIQSGGGDGAGGDSGDSGGGGRRGRVETAAGRIHDDVDFSRGRQFDQRSGKVVGAALASIARDAAKAAKAAAAKAARAKAARAAAAAKTAAAVERAAAAMKKRQREEEPDEVGAEKLTEVVRNTKKKKKKTKATTLAVMASCKEIQNYVELLSTVGAATVDAKTVKTLLKDLTSHELPTKKSKVKQITQCVLQLRALSVSDENGKAQLLVNKVLARWMPETQDGAMAQAVRAVEEAIDAFDKVVPTNAAAEEALLAAVDANTACLAPRRSSYSWKGLKGSSAVDVVKRLHKCKSKRLKAAAKALLGMWTEDLGDPPTM
jgi:hypothetical protein